MTATNQTETGAADADNPVVLYRKEGDRTTTTAVPAAPVGSGAGPRPSPASVKQRWPYARPPDAAAAVYTESGTSTSSARPAR
jgi:hypothetical protein